MERAEPDEPIELFDQILRKKGIPLQTGDRVRGSPLASAPGRHLVKRFLALFVLGGSLLALQGNAIAAAPSIPWQKCTESAQRGFQCATIKVPLYYDDPRGRQIHLAMVRHRATNRDRRIGTVFYEPGGPGVR